MALKSIITTQSFLKLLFESVLIIFSVLLALFLNEYRGDLKEERQKDLAMQMVNVELRANSVTLNSWLNYHRQVLQNLNKAIDGDPNQAVLFSEDGKLVTQLLPQGVVQNLLNDTSWQTLKASSVASRVDFATMLTLSELYKLQAEGVETTLKSILAILSSRAVYEASNQKVLMMQMRNLFAELVAQEVFLIQKYGQALAVLENAETDTVNAP